MASERLLTTSVGARALVDDVEGTEHRRVQIEHVPISGNECHVIADFANDQLERVAIVLSDAAADRVGLKPALNRFTDCPGEIAYLEDWVRRQTGRKPPAAFAWGMISVVVDDKGGFASIVCRYS